MLAEDDADFALLLRTAFECENLPVSFKVVSDGTELVEYLEGRDPYGNRAAYPFPKMVVLDLNLPRLDGFAVLRWIRSRPELKDLQVVVLTGVQIEREARLAHDLGANTYLVKPFQFLKLLEMARWLWDSLTTGAQIPEPEPAHS